MGCFEIRTWDDSEGINCAVYKLPGTEFVNEKEYDFPIFFVKNEDLEKFSINNLTQEVTHRLKDHLDIGSSLNRNKLSYDPETNSFSEGVSKNEP